MNEILIRLGSGSLETGFPSVNVELRGQKHNWEATTSLLAAPELKNIYQEWLFLYRASLRWTEQRGVKFAAATPTNFSIQDIYQITHKLTTALNRWLNQGDFYTKIQAQLRTDLDDLDSISIGIITDDLLLWQLPWHRWDFFAAYDRCVEFFSKPQFKGNFQRKLQPNGRVDILAIWGDAPDLNLNSDLTALNQPRAKVRSHQPKSALEISNLLAQRQTNILFFGGHGETIELELAGTQQTLGTIYLDKDTPISIDKIKSDLKQAVDRGLQIAIFNCCSGLGLAQAVTDLNIPYLIVMRSQIPDKLAQQFCRDLLVRYSQGETFPTAFQYARARLKPATDRHDEFESWLPMLFHNPNSDRVTWQQLCRLWWQFPLPQSVVTANQWLTKPQHLPLTWLGISLLSTGIAVGLQSIVPIQKLESLAIDRFQALQVTLNPAKTHVVVIDPRDREDGSETGRIVANDESISSELQLQELSQISDLAIGLDLKIEHQTSDSLLDKPNIKFNCAELPPTMIYSSQITPDCSALAWTVTKKYSQADRAIDAQQPMILNPYLGAMITQIHLSDLGKLIKSNPAMFKDKIILVGVVKDKSSPIMIHAIATEQIIRSSVEHQPLLTPIDNSIGTIYVLIWSGFSNAAIFATGRRLSIAVGVIIFSVSTSWLLFIAGYLLPLVPTIIAIGIGASLIHLARHPHHSTNFQDL
jgi:CHASE2 domain-containing sensor protein